MNRKYLFLVIVLATILSCLFPVNAFSQFPEEGTISIAPDSGPVCSPIFLTGSGYDANWQVDVNWGENLLVARTLTDVDGNFSVSFPAPEMPPATYPIRVTVYRINCGIDQNGVPIECPIADAPGVVKNTSFTIIEPSVGADAYCDTTAVGGTSVLPFTGMDLNIVYFFILLVIIWLYVNQLRTRHFNKNAS